LMERRRPARGSVEQKPMSEFVRPSTGICWTSRRDLATNKNSLEDNKLLIFRVNKILFLELGTGNFSSFELSTSSNLGRVK
jgi:hypothetical protein